MDKKYTVETNSLQPFRYETTAPALPDAEKLDCSVDITLSVIGGKWKAAILWLLRRENRPVRFAEFRKALPTITQRMLTRQLRELEAQGMIYRDVYPVTPPRVEYGLTARGETLSPVLEAMCKWGRDNGWKEKL